MKTKQITYLKQLSAVLITALDTVMPNNLVSAVMCGDRFAHHWAIEQEEPNE